MLHLYRNCDAVDCKSTKGRDFSKPGTDLELVKCQTCGQSGVHVICGKLNAKERLYVCSTCKPTDDEDDDDEELQAQLLKHDQRRLELLARKEQLIKEEKERLAATKKKQDDMIAKIKAIFAADDSIDQESKDEDEDIKYIGSKEAGARVQIVNRLTGDCVPVQAQPPPPVPFRLLSGSSTNTIRPNTAIGFLPRRQMEEKDSSSSEEEEDEELNKVLKISAIFSGDDVGKLDAFLPKHCIAETPPPSKSIIAETPPPSKGTAETPHPTKAETEVQKIRQNLTSTESHNSNENAASSSPDPVNALKENVITAVDREETTESSEKPMMEEQSDDDLEEILADEFIDQDSPDTGVSS